MRTDTVCLVHTYNPSGRHRMELIRSGQYMLVNKQMQSVLLWFKTGMEKEVQDVVLSLLVDIEGQS